MKKKSTIITAAATLGLAFALSACTGGAGVETPAPGVSAPTTATQAPAPAPEAPATEAPSEKAAVATPEEAPSIRKVQVANAVKKAYTGTQYENLLTDTQDTFFLVQQGLLDAYVAGDRAKVTQALDDHITSDARSIIEKALADGDQGTLDALYPSANAETGVLFSHEGKDYRTPNTEASPITVVRTVTPRIDMAQDGEGVLYETTYTLYVKGLADDGTQATYSGSATVVYTFKVGSDDHWNLDGWWMQADTDARVEVGA